MALPDEQQDLDFKARLADWKWRDSLCRKRYGQIVTFKEDERKQQDEKAARRAAGVSAETEASKNSATAAVVAVVVGTTLIRFGGRALLASFLGLDLISDLGIKDNIDEALAYADSVGDLKIFAFIAAFVASKVFLLDFITITLAISSGILFGGVLEGAAISSLATLGSLLAFVLSRTLLQDRVQGTIEKQPVARGLAKVVEEDGFKTVFVFRLAPIIPALPLGAYPYIYGTTKLKPQTFCAGYFLGSLKPYLLDSYIGVLSKQVLDGDTMDSSKDLILIVGLAVLVLVGTFATEIAQESWDAVRLEIEADAEAREEAELLGDVEKPVDSGWKIGPVDVTGVRDGMVALVPEEIRMEFALVSSKLGQFNDDRFELAVKETVVNLREKELNNDEQETFDLSSIFRKKGKEEAEPVSGDLSELAEWSIAGPWWRQLLEKALFPGSVLAGLSRKFNNYPTTIEKLDQIIEGVDRRQTEAGEKVTGTDGSTQQSEVVNRTSIKTRLKLAEARLAEVKEQLAKMEE
jgi:uncharacterized membrane protein YdjX (TVP38/TMEM64 family)